MTEQQIDRERLRKLADAATEGPWEADIDNVYTVGRDGYGVAYDSTGEDAEFIAAAREAVPALLDALTRAESQSETRRQQTVYWQERAEGFEAKMNELDRAYISEHGQRRRAEDEQDRLKNKLARRSGTVSRLLEERNNAEARIQAVRGIAPTIPTDDDDHAWRVMTDLEAGEMFAWQDVLDILNS